MSGIDQAAGVTYAIAVTVHLPCGDTLAATRTALTAQEFAVLTEIDMQATLTTKLALGGH